MNFLGIIPARYGSTRLEGKPLADICGKPMIQHVYERASSILDFVYVATDDDRIENAVKKFGGNVIITSPEHNSGSNRCLEAYDKITEMTREKFDVILNIQGDEPMLHKEQLTSLMGCFNDPATELATLVFEVTDPADLDSTSDAFVAINKNMNALYFSRAVIPVIRGVDKTEWFGRSKFYKHIGLYAYTPAALKLFSSLVQTPLEIAEGLEQNRWLEHGHFIKVAVTNQESVSVDTKEDLEKIRDLMCKGEST